MASPNATFTEMVTTTLRNHTTDIADNVSDNNALYNRLRKKGQIKTKSGGYEIAVPLDYAENATFQRYSGYDTLNISASDVLSAAKFDWNQSAVHVTASGKELRQNSGKEAMIDLVKARTKNARRTAANNMSIDLYSDGSLSNQMDGLAAQITSAGTGTVGGINSTTFSFWQNQIREFIGTIGSDTIKDNMQAIWLSCVRGADAPDLIVASHDMYAYYWDSLTDLQRFAGSDEADMGFQSLKFVGADVIFDSNSNFATTAKEMFFINTDYMELVEHREAKWSMLEEKNSVNQDAVVMPLIWMGALCTSNRSLQGKLFDEA